MSHHLTNDFATLVDRKYPAICHRSSVNISALTPADPCFTISHSTPRTHTETLTFIPGTRDEFVQALQGSQHFKGSDVDDIRYHVEVKHKTANQMKGGRWVAYAIRVTVTRFWELAKVCNEPLATFSLAAS